jgi:hypothetical protein
MRRGSEAQSYRDIPQRQSQVSPLYLNEFQFRFNNRRESDIFGKAIEGWLTLKRGDRRALQMLANDASKPKQLTLCLDRPMSYKLDYRKQRSHKDNKY